MVWGVSRTSSALALIWLWQAKQLFRRMGSTSLVKSTVVLRSRGAIGIPAAAPQTAGDQRIPTPMTQQKQTVQIRILMRDCDNPIQVPWPTPYGLAALATAGVA